MENVTVTMTREQWEAIADMVDRADTDIAGDKYIDEDYTEEEARALRAKCATALAASQIEPTPATVEQMWDETLKDTYRGRARDEYASDEIEIDDDAKVSVGDDGAFVQAWVWVRREDEGDV